MDDDIFKQADVLELRLEQLKERLKLIQFYYEATLWTRDALAAMEIAYKLTDSFYPDIQMQETTLKELKSQRKAKTFIQQLRSAIVDERRLKARIAKEGKYLKKLAFYVGLFGSMIEDTPLTKVSQKKMLDQGMSMGLLKAEQYERFKWIGKFAGRDPDPEEYAEEPYCAYCGCRKDKIETACPDCQSSDYLLQGALHLLVRDFAAEKILTRALRPTSDNK